MTTKGDVDGYPSGYFTYPTALAAEGARVGVATCLECGTAILLDPRNETDYLQIHISWHAAGGRDDTG
jgi:ferredoxin-like protein FixX